MQSSSSSSSISSPLLPQPQSPPIVRSLTDAMSALSLRHKIVLTILVSLSVYTIVTSQTISALIGYRHTLLAALRQSSSDNGGGGQLWPNRGRRTVDSSGQLLYYHLANATVDHMMYYYDIDGDSGGNGGHNRVVCHKLGTDWNRTLGNTRNNSCQCMDHYYTGLDCGLPLAIADRLPAEDSSRLQKRLRRVSKARRVILSLILYTMVGNNNIDSDNNTNNSRTRQQLVNQMNQTIYKLMDLTDLLVITEIQLTSSSSSSSSGDRNRKCLKINNTIDNNNNCGNNSDVNNDLLMQMVTNKLNKYSDIVIYNRLNITSKQWSAIGPQGLYLYTMSKVWQTCLHRVTDYRPDDLLVFMSANAFPQRSVLMFFKHYTGYPEPIKLLLTGHYPLQQYKHNNIGDKLAKRLTEPAIVNHCKLVNTIVTFEYLTLLCRYDFQLFKTNQCLNSSNKKFLHKFNQTYWPVRYWSLSANSNNNNNSNSSNFLTIL
ncbi:uncharacterized protein LOC128956099 [Oppia nitens]|uniref:uncharacterized protein LOC128956099 n=1 Tax=Oppia nitens TaxID=1686743 RepID=UPI0023DAA952|nr:uncharacterized protein LOC128956099 [Oppia nitens]